MGAGASLFLKRTPRVLISFLVSYSINMFGKVSISIIGEVLIIELREVVIIELREVVMIEQSRLIGNIVKSTFMLLMEARAVCALLSPTLLCRMSQQAKLSNMHRQYMHSCKALHWQV